MDHLSIGTGAWAGAAGSYLKGSLRCGRDDKPWDGAVGGEEKDLRFEIDPRRRVGTSFSALPHQDNRERRSVFIAMG